MKSNGWIRRFSGLWLAPPLRGLGTTRDQLTSVRLAFGGLAALVLTAGPDAFPTAAAVFLIGFVLSRCDDELATLSTQTDSKSDRYAFFGNSLSNALAFVGLGVGMRASEYGLHSVVMGLFAALAVAFVPWLAQRLEIIEGHRSPEFDSFGGFDADDMVLLVPVALWAGWANGLLIIAAFGGVAFAGALYMTHFRKFNSG